ncbi:MAG TPA: acyl-CoA thioesterase [Tepidisphaeraceae bacterium]|jgi:acyl-CoA thioester hydrolase
MQQPPRRQKSGYFPSDPAAPAPLIVRLTHRVRFSDVDPMAILWHGRYAQLFEQANEELGRVIGMSYPDFKRERLMAPIVQLHVDYFAPVTLGEQVTVIGKMVWCDGARSNIEYEVRKETGPLAAAGYTVQMFVDETGTPLMASPPLLENCRRRWRGGEFASAQ